MNTVTAKVFRAGNSRALRLPRSLPVTAKEYEVTPTADGFAVVDPAARAKRLRALDRLMRQPALTEPWPRPQ